MRSRSSKNQSSGHTLLLSFVLIGAVSALAVGFMRTIKFGLNRHGQLTLDVAVMATKRQLVRSRRCFVLDADTCAALVEVRQRAADGTGPLGQEYLRVRTLRR